MMIEARCQVAGVSYRQEEIRAALKVATPDPPGGLDLWSEDAESIGWITAVLAPLQNDHDPTAVGVFCAGAGSVRNRSGKAYKPSAVAGYRRSLVNEILPDLGTHPLQQIRREDMQEFVDRLLAKGLDPSTVRNHLMPLRVIFRRKLARGVVSINPTAGLELPAVEGRRERVASPAEAERLLGALPFPDRAVWATAMYAGLRSGELQALEWSNVDLATGIIRVEQSYDPKCHEYVAPKSKAGRRRVPIPAILRDVLVEHRMNGDGVGLVFGRAAERPFANTVIRDRALRSWRTAGLDPIGLHECRHTCASVWIAAGVNAKAITTFMGHANISTTYDLYGHLMPGGEDDAVVLIDAFYERTATSNATRTPEPA